MSSCRLQTLEMFSGLTFVWVTVGFVLLQMCMLYWYLEVDEWDYYLTRSSSPVPSPPPELQLSIRTTANTAQVSYGNTSVLMDMTRASYAKHPHMLDYSFMAANTTAIAGLTGSNFLLLSHPKDRTRMRMSLLKHIHGATNGTEGLTCVVVWHTDFETNEGLADWCVVADKDLYMIKADGVPHIFNTPTRHPLFYALFNTEKALPAEIPGTVDADAYASWFITAEMERDINYLCINTVFERKNDTTYMIGTFDGDNSFGTRYDRGVAMADDGYFNTLVRFKHCPAWRYLAHRPDIAAAVRTKWQAARQNALSDDNLEAFIDGFIATHGSAARTTFDLYDDGRGRRKYSAVYNTFLSDVFVARNVHAYPGGYMVRVPRTYDEHVADLRKYLLARTKWMDAHINNLEIKPSPGPVHPVFVAGFSITVLYLTIAVATCGFAISRWHARRTPQYRRLTTIF